jgi:hypothetical protein
MERTKAPKISAQDKTLASRSQGRCLIPISSITNVKKARRWNLEVGSDVLEYPWAGLHEPEALPHIDRRKATIESQRLDFVFRFIVRNHNLRNISRGKKGKKIGDTCSRSSFMNRWSVPTPLDTKKQIAALLLLWGLIESSASGTRYVNRVSVAS